MAGEIGAFLGGFSGSTIGSAVVKLYLDETAYNADLAKTSAATTASTSKMGGAFAQLKGLGVLAYAAIGTAAVAFAADSIAAAREHEVAVTRLRDAVGLAADGFEDQATALQMLSGFSDEAILDATTLLSKYDLTTSQLKELNPLVVDYARFTGKDVATAAGDLGKALLGNTRALKAVGVEYVATGDRTADLATLMAALEEKVGGAAAAFGETSEGKAAKLRESFEELKESIGQGLLPTLDSLTASIQGLADTINSDGLRAVIDMGERIRGLTSFMFTGRLEFKKFVDTIEVGSVTATQSADEIAAAIEGTAESTSKASRAMARFADMTKKELREFKEATREAFSTADDVFSKLSERSNVTADDVAQAFRRQNRALTNYAQNVREVRQLGLEDDVIAALSELGLEGADIFEGLADSSKREIDKVNATFDTNVAKAGIVTSSLVGVDGAIKKLDGRKANAEVIVKYTIAGIDPRGLPGLEEAS